MNGSGILFTIDQLGAEVSALRDELGQAREQLGNLQAENESLYAAQADTESEKGAIARELEEARTQLAAANAATAQESDEVGYITHVSSPDAPAFGPFPQFRGMGGLVGSDKKNSPENAETESTNGPE
jgi:hypothetical protein